MLRLLQLLSRHSCICISGKKDNRNPAKCNQASQDSFLEGVLIIISRLSGGSAGQLPDRQKYEKINCMSLFVTYVSYHASEYLWVNVL